MIEPGVGTDFYRIGEPITETDLSDLKLLEEDRGSIMVYKTESVWFFVDKDSGALDQICFFNPSKEKVLNKIGIGDTLEGIEKHFGECVVTDGVFEPVGKPGIGFELNLENIILSISVYKPYKTHAELPEHIKRNLDGKKIHLP